MMRLSFDLPAQILDGHYYSSHEHSYGEDGHRACTCQTGVVSSVVNLKARNGTKKRAKKSTEEHDYLQTIGC